MLEMTTEREEALGGEQWEQEERAARRNQGRQLAVYIPTLLADTRGSYRPAACPVVANSADLLRTPLGVPHTQPAATPSSVPPSQLFFQGKRQQRCFSCAITRIPGHQEICKSPGGLKKLPPGAEPETLSVTAAAPCHGGAQCSAASCRISDSAATRKGSAPGTMRQSLKTSALSPAQ